MGIVDGKIFSSNADRKEATLATIDKMIQQRFRRSNNHLWVKTQTQAKWKKSLKL